VEVGGNCTTKCSGRLHLLEFVPDRLQPHSLVFAYIQSPHDVVISLDNALWDVASAQCHRRVD
jgi:hypothetical protein